MQYRRPAGFTVVELIVVIVMITILTGMAVFSLINQQSIGRDSERKTKAENIARGLERYYAANSQYPSTTTAAGIVSGDVLPDMKDTDYIYTFNNNTTAFTVTNLATSGSVTDISADAQATTNNIVYLPMMYSGGWQVCDSAEICTRFVLTYAIDSGVDVHIKSRRQQ